MKGKNSSSISQPSLNHISLSFIWEKVGVEEELSCWRACDRLSLHLWLAKDNRLIIPRAPMKGFWWHLDVGSFQNLVPSVPFLLVELLWGTVRAWRRQRNYWLGANMSWPLTGFLSLPSGRLTKRRWTWCQTVRTSSRFPFQRQPVNF